MVMDHSSGIKSTSEKQIPDPTNLLNEIASIQEEFYSSRKKNIFYKNSQKKDCADYVAMQMSLDELIDHTIFLFHDDKFIYVDYTLFKQYGTASCYDAILQRLFSCIHKALDKNGTYELHVNLSTFSISALERYQEVIKQFYQIYFSGDIDYGLHLSQLYIYYVPTMIHTISNILSKYINSETALKRSMIRDKVTMYNKEESSTKMKHILSSSTL